MTYRTVLDFDNHLLEVIRSPAVEIMYWLSLIGKYSYRMVNISTVNEIWTYNTHAGNPFRQRRTHNIVMLYTRL